MLLKGLWLFRQEDRHRRHFLSAYKFLQILQIVQSILLEDIPLSTRIVQKQITWLIPQTSVLNTPEHGHR